MFNSKLRAQKKSLEAEVEGLRGDVQKAEHELSTVKHQKKMEDEDIKHMVKISKEKQELELKRKVMDCESEKERAIATVKDEYRDKMESRLQKEVDNMKEMYGQILERLPNVTARLKGDI